MRLKLVENIEVLEEAINPSEALKLKENSDAYAILYGWRYKNEPAVELYPEEHSEESLRQRMDQIIKDYHKYSEINSKGNRYAYERDFIFYVLYNHKDRLKEDFLEEAKKHKNKKKKKIDYTEFNTPAKLKAWVKKRQKGLSPFTYLNPNAGNVEYNQSIFNQMMGSADGASSLGVSNGGISNGGLSAPAGDGGGMAMGEALDWDNGEKRYIETSSLDLIEMYRNLLDEHLDKFIGELFHVADAKVYLNIIKMLRESDIELPTAQQVLDAMIEMGYATRNSFVIYNQLVKDLGI